MPPRTGFLTPEDAYEILKTTGISYAKLGKQYGVSRTTISKIKKGISHRNVYERYHIEERLNDVVDHSDAVYCYKHGSTVTISVRDTKFIINLDTKTIKIGFNTEIIGDRIEYYEFIRFLINSEIL